MTSGFITLLLIKFFFGFVEDFGRIFVSLMLFRFPVKNMINYAIIAAIINSISDTFLLDIAHIPFGVNEIISIGIDLITLMLLMKLQFWYSFLLDFVFYIIGTISQLLVVLPSAAIGFVTMKSIADNIFYTCFLQTLGCVVGFAIMIPLYKKGIGFFILNKHVNFHEKINKTVFICVVFSVILFELILYYMIEHDIKGSNILNLTLVVMVSSLIIVYVKNRIDLKNKYRDIKPKDYEV